MLGPRTSHFNCICHQLMDELIWLPFLDWFGLPFLSCFGECKAELLFTLLTMCRRLWCDHLVSVDIVIVVHDGQLRSCQHHIIIKFLPFRAVLGKKAVEAFQFSSVTSTGDLIQIFQELRVTDDFLYCKMCWAARSKPFRPLHFLTREWKMIALVFSLPNFPRVLVDDVILKWKPAFFQFLLITPTSLCRLPQMICGGLCPVRQLSTVLSFHSSLLLHWFCYMPQIEVMLLLLALMHVLAIEGQQSVAIRSTWNFSCSSLLRHRIKPVFFTCNRTACFRDMNQLCGWYFVGSLAHHGIKTIFGTECRAVEPSITTQPGFCPI